MNTILKLLSIPIHLFPCTHTRALEITPGRIKYIKTLRVMQDDDGFPVCCFDGNLR